jgi:hypothetical protein
MSGDFAPSPQPAPDYLELARPLEELSPDDRARLWVNAVANNPSLDRFALSQEGQAASEQAFDDILGIRVSQELDEGTPEQWAAYEDRFAEIVRADSGVRKKNMFLADLLNELDRTADYNTTGGTTVLLSCLYTTARLSQYPGFTLVAQFNGLWAVYCAGADRIDN